MSKRFALSLIVAAAITPAAFAQTSSVAAQQRILEPVVINSQTVQGALVVQNGAVQTFTCQSPQPYATADQSESGWACFEGATGEWLLHARPPQGAYTQAPPIQYPEAPPYDPPATVAAPPATAYAYPYYDDYPYYGYYPYSYGYYPYGYYPYAGFGFGFGFGYRSTVFVNRPVVVRGPFVGGRPGGVVVGGTGRSFVASRGVSGSVSGGAIRSVGGRTGGSAGGGRR
jgi:hypothetical protein